MKCVGWVEFLVGGRRPGRAPAAQPQHGARPLREAATGRVLQGGRWDRQVGSGSLCLGCATTIIIFLDASASHTVLARMPYCYKSRGVLSTEQFLTTCYKDICKWPIFDILTSLTLMP